MKFQKYLANTCVPEWSAAYVNYKGLKKIIKTIDKDDNYFLTQLQNELTKTQLFFLEQCATLPGRIAFLENKLTTLTSAAASNNNLVELKQTRLLLREFHRYCTFLKNFQKLNRIAFAKILKKYDKTFESDLKKHVLEVFTEDPIFEDDRPGEYMRKAEDLLELFFTHCAAHYPKMLKQPGTHSQRNITSRSLTMHYIRGRGKQADEFAFFRVGLYIGVSTPLIVTSLVKIFQLGLIVEPIWRQVLYMFGGMFIIVLSFFGFSIDLYLWRRYRINYVFIFELNLQHVLSYKQFAEFAAISLFLWSVVFYFTIHGTINNLIPFQYLPLLLILLYLAVLLMPIPVFYASSRKWFLKALFHIFTPGIRKVTFKDFFIADLLISLTFFWTSLYLTACFYANGKDKSAELCSPSTSWFTPLLISVPLLIRFIQCLRKYYDSNWIRKKNLWNAGKYMVAISAVFASSFNSINKGGWALGIWIFFAAISTGYSYYWDLYKDWNIRGNDKVISKRALYVVAALNLVLRANWILTINAFLLFDQIILSFLFGCLEICRRYLWALFRVELEHSHNVENFRAIKDIPLLEDPEDEEGDA